MTPPPPTPPRPTPAARRRGAALLVVLFAMLMVSSLAIAFQAASTTSTAVASNVARHAEARGVAESGLVAAMAYVQAAEDWRNQHTHGVWTADVAFAGGTFAFRFDDEDGDLADDVSDPFTITAIGRVDGAAHEVTAYVRPTTTATRVLLVAGDSSLSDKDEALKALFESWGFHVTTIADNESQPAFDAAIADADVVYISEDVNSGSVAGKLDDAAIGVVNEEPYLHDALGFTSGNGTAYSADNTDVVNAGHDITSQFSAGTLQITTDDESVRTSGTLAPGATKLTERVGGSDGGLVVLETGAARIDGSPAPARRVLLPVGGGSFHPDQLNAAGETMIQRALTWAAAEGGSSGLTASWFAGLSNPSSLDDIDFSATPDHTSAESQVNWPNTSNPFYTGGPTDNFAVRVAGQITVSEAGNWGFKLGSDDGSRLWIDGTLVVDHDGLHAFSERTGTVSLAAGTYSFEARFFERGGGQGLVASWQPPGSSDWEVIPESAFAGESAEEGVTPQLVARYTFEEPTAVYPVLLAHWRLDEAAPNGGSPEDGGIAVDHKIDMQNESYIDSYSSSAGAYGGSNRGSEAVVSTNRTSGNSIKSKGDSEIRGDAYCGPGGNVNSVISADVTGDKLQLDSSVDVSLPDWPTGLPGNQGDLEVTGNTTWTSDKYFDKLVIKDEARLTIDGDVTIACEKEFHVDNEARIVINPGSTLRVHAREEIVIKNESRVNADSTATGRLYLYSHNSDRDVKLDNEAEVAGTIYSANDVDMSNESRFYGRMLIGKWLRMDNESRVHFDTDFVGGGGGVPDAADSAGSNTGAVNSGAAGGHSGQHGTAYFFDGSDGFVEVPHHADFLLDEGAVSFWFKASDLNGMQGLFSKDSNGYDDGGHLTIELNGSTLQVRLQSDQDSHWVTASGLSTNTWYHVVFTWGAGGMSLYLDTALADSDDYTGGLGSSSGGTGNQEPIVFGAGATLSDDQSTDGWDEPFHGYVDDVRIYDTPLSLPQIAAVAADTTLPANDPATVYDTSGYGAALDLTIEDPDHVDWLSGGGIDITEATRIASPAAATKLYDAVAVTGEVTIEAKFIPADLFQGGLARIVTYSASGSDRNVTLGQDDAAVEARVRTDAVSNNATPGVETADVLGDASVQHVILTYDAENDEVRIYHNGSLALTESQAGDFNWDAAHRLLLGNELGANDPWLGQLFRVAIYDRSVNAIQAENLVNGNSPGPAELAAEDVAFEYRWVERP